MIQTSIKLEKFFNLKKIVNYLIKQGVDPCIFESEGFSIINTLVNYNLIINVTYGGWFKCFGYYKESIKVITVIVPVWCYFWRNWAAYKIILHELGHYYGIESCSNVSCLMYENDKNWKENIVMPIQFLRGFNYCKKCKKFLEDNKRG